jgi:hypothetical protein
MEEVEIEKGIKREGKERKREERRKIGREKEEQ